MAVEAVPSADRDITLAAMLTYDALGWLVSGVAPRHGVTDFERFASAEEALREVAAFGVAAHVRAAVLAFDAVALASSADVLRGLVRESEGGPKRAQLAIADAWIQVLAGDAAAARDYATAAFDIASGRFAPELIEATVLLAWADEIDGALEAAASHARRASRMARTESLPQEEYLANLALARLRRLSDKPYLAGRILSALVRVATAPWQAWMGWELLLAGAPVEPPSEPQAASEFAVRRLVELRRAAAAGRREAFEAARASLATATEGFTLLAAEGAAVAELLDPDGPDSAFRRGETDRVPRGLASLGVQGDGEAVYVVAVGSRRTRVLAPGRALVPDAVSIPEVHRQARTDATIAALLLAGEDGAEEAALFLRVYGFAYQPELHETAFKVLVHRVRKRLEGFATLVRAHGHIRLVDARALLAPDPRCSPPAEHALLLMLASAGHTTARDAAEALGIPVRTAQDALRRLADDGACRAEKQGRKKVYLLEDTTFLEPTKVPRKPT